MSDVTKIKLPDNSELNIKDYRIPGVDSTPTSGSNNVVTSGGIHTAMADTELVVATALNDLNDRVSDLEDGAVTESYVDAAVAGIVNSAPTTLDTLNELATALGNDPNFATTVATQIGQKQDVLVSGTSIKTINNESLLGSGNITISGGGIVPDLGNAKIFYGTCDTAAATTKKEVTCSAFTSADFVAGALIFVKFTNTNSGAVASLTMDVNSTGEVRLKKMYKNTAPSDLTAVAELQAGVTYLFTYTGSAWVCITLDYNTTYSGMTAAEATAGTGTTARLITPARLKSAIETWAPNNIFLATYGTTTYAEVKAAYDAGKWVFCKRELNPDLYIIPLSYIDPSSGSEQANFSITAGSNELSLAILDGTDDSWTFNTYVCGDVKGVMMNGTTYNPSNSGLVNLGTVLTSETSLSKGTTTGSGNAVTDISVSGHEITLTKGTTFLTSHQDISGKANLSGAAFTGTVTGTSSGNASQFRNITISSSEPTASDGSNGDIWIVI